MEKNTPRFLILAGVRLSDLVVKTPCVNTVTPSVKVYSEIPKEFTDVKTWPTFTNLKCHHCGVIPKDYPRFIPTNPRKDAAGKFRCGVIGVFHTWNCAAAYIETQIPERIRRETQRVLCIVEEKFTGRRRAYIPAAPPCTEKREYCGSSGLTPVEYDRKIADLDAVCSIYI
jgi:hypothetical protein